MPSLTLVLGCLLEWNEICVGLAIGLITLQMPYPRMMTPSIYVLQTTRLAFRSILQRGISLSRLELNLGVNGD